MRMRFSVHTREFWRSSREFDVSKPKLSQDEFLLHTSAKLPSGLFTLQPRRFNGLGVDALLFPNDLLELRLVRAGSLDTHRREPLNHARILGDARNLFLKSVDDWQRRVRRSKKSLPRGHFETGDHITYGRHVWELRHSFGCGDAEDPNMIVLHVG